MEVLQCTTSVKGERLAFGASLMWPLKELQLFGTSMLASLLSRQTLLFSLFYMCFWSSCTYTATSRLYVQAAFFAADLYMFDIVNVAIHIVLVGLPG